MNGKQLGKITSAEFGSVSDYPFLMGLVLHFNLGCGGKYTVNIGDSCNWENPSDRADAITRIVDQINEILKEAKTNCVSGLVGIPVEVEIEDMTFKNFRILTEVL